MSGFITIACPSCGGTLYTMEDAERVTCVHCGKETELKRGETPEQPPPEEQPPPAAEPVQAPTAARLEAARVLETLPAARDWVEQVEAAAVQRLTREIAELRKKRQKASERQEQAKRAAPAAPTRLTLIGVAACLLACFGCLLLEIAAVELGSGLAEEPALVSNGRYVLFAILVGGLYLANRGQKAYAARRAEQARSRAAIDGAAAALDAQLAAKTAELEKRSGRAPAPKG